MKEILLVTVNRKRSEFIHREIEVSVDGEIIDEYSDIPYESGDASVVQSLLEKLSQNGAINLKIESRTE